MAIRSGAAKDVLNDDRGIVINWLLKVIVGLVIVGVLMFELVAVLLVRGTAAGTAQDAATEAGFEYRNTSDEKAAQLAAEQLIGSRGAHLLRFSIDPVNRTTTITVRKEAQTIFIQYIGPLKKFRIATSTQTVPLPT